MPKVSLNQDGLHLYMELSEKTIARMIEIRSQDPETWKGRSIDLFIEAGCMQREARELLRKNTHRKE